MRRNPQCWSFSIGIFYIYSSLRLLYWIATPLEGCEVLSFQGGSIIITSNILIPKFICVLTSRFQLKVVTSAQMGIELGLTCDFLPIIRDLFYLFYHLISVEIQFGSIWFFIWLFWVGGLISRGCLVDDRLWHVSHRYHFMIFSYWTYQFSIIFLIIVFYFFFFFLNDI
jgi:hypothetical protein